MAAPESGLRPHVVRTRRLHGSTNVDVGDEGLGVYAATKAATRQFSRTWANELKRRGIQVNPITPGPTDTPALRGLTPTRSSSSSTWLRACRWAGSGARRRSPRP
ncbi:SDR family NAD(P)-dependent oxidoreductase [Nonomuraea sp. NPDC003709]|uniref:SDR family NAD(P)-dependent oxidoreductase n=1 Tax=Nonomuraea sp. NPDC003709 TaxID=3154450 RepID=UPI0033A51CEB